MKLTKAQREVLEFAAHCAWGHQVHAGWQSGWTGTQESGPKSSTLIALDRRGLLEVSYRNDGVLSGSITDAGRAALRACGKT